MVESHTPHLAHLSGCGAPGPGHDTRHVVEGLEARILFPELLREEWVRVWALFPLEKSPEITLLYVQSYQAARAAAEGYTLL